MTNSHTGNVAYRWTTTFLQTLQVFGVRHAVISPGSRSTPLTLATAANKNFQKHVILDERSAAFTALGIGKATNIPALLICTSGTAVANYFPAVIEARQSGVPLILATADRPPQLRATGANQAIDQLKIFGHYPVFFHEVGEPKEAAEDLNRLQVLAQQAITMSLEKRGPVHLNFAFHKPLEPDPQVLKEQPKVSNTASLVNEEILEHTLQLSGAVQQIISEAVKPLIIVGPLAPGDSTKSITKLADILRCPIVSESTINHSNTISGFPGFLRSDKLRAEFAPDLILRFGFQPVSKCLEWGLKDWNPTHHLHFASTNAWQDATSSGAERISWMGKKIRWNNLEESPNSDWLDQWKSAKNRFSKHYEEAINQQKVLSDGAIYHHFTPQLTEEHFIGISNSFPARDISLFGKQSQDIPVFMNRGASGIDGITSTAIGLSLAQQRPGVVFIGDLAFLHDTNALLNSQKLQYPLTLIILNNSGGSIFRMLPIEEYSEYFNTYFETPQSVNIKQLVQAYDIPYRSIDTLSMLYDTNISNWMSQHPGLSIIECKTDADASMKLRKSLWNFSQ
jgi:2-succinyl-5-enolpyruvyl-6-hydroxy-3-cyclohexene-1-carboxylate synthase